MKCSTQLLLTILAPIIVFAILLGIVLLYFFYLRSEESCNYAFINQDDDLDMESLFLTPYIKRGEIRKGQRLASVRDWSGVDSYSGYLSVSKVSHLFFWFFPQNNDIHNFGRIKDGTSAPVVLYLQGGPGISSMFGLFLETGPFHIDSNLDFHLRNFSWTQTHSVLYIDSPVGTGFSFTDSETAYAKEQKDVSRDLYQALLQFFTLFPQFREADFYIAGTSYAGKYIPMIADKIHLENQESPLVPINLKGIAIGSGYFDSILQDEFSDYYYNMGLLDAKQKSLYQTKEARIKRLVTDELFTEARDSIAHLFEDLRENFTGFDDILIHNALEPHTPPGLTSFEKFLNKKCIRSALHTGNQTFSMISYEAYTNFLAKDFFRSTRPELERLLDLNYKVLIFASQLDTIIIHTTVAKFLRSLVWYGANTYRTIERGIWRVGGEISGYVKQTANFVHVLIRNSGHVACHEQPEWCLDMINRFTNGTSFREVLH